MLKVQPSAERLGEARRAGLRKLNNTIIAVASTVLLAFLILRIMITHRIKQIPSGFDYQTTSEFEDYDFDEIPNNVEELWYWYATAPCEGSGHILMRTDDGLWHHHDCGHCSCYGSIERISVKDGQPLADLLTRCSGDLLKELKPLTDAISQANVKELATPPTGTAETEIES